MHESQSHEFNSFLTLTYDDKHLPAYGSLVPDHFTKFMKRFRKRSGTKTRYYMCGEYGEKFSRPHYHAVIFGYNWPDKKLWKIDPQTKEPLYTSEFCSDLWPKGFHAIGSVTFESAAYVARYILKKQTGAPAEAHYMSHPDIYGEINAIEPEYNRMSRRPGIAADWYQKFKTDVFPDDFVIHEGKQLKTPRFYTNRYELENPIGFAALKEKRRKKALELAPENTPDRLATREFIAKERLRKLKRSQETTI